MNSHTQYTLIKRVVTGTCVAGRVLSHGGVERAVLRGKGDYYEVDRFQVNVAS